MRSTMGGASAASQGDGLDIYMTRIIRVEVRVKM